MRWIAVALMLAAPAAAKGPPPALPPPVPPPPPANCTAAEHRQFDFWVGRWDVRQTGKLEEMRGISTVESINFGCGIRETWQPFTSITGASLSTYDPRDRAWHQTWIDAANARVEFTGGLREGRMVLTGVWRGRDREGTMRMTLWPTSEGYVRQAGEVSFDDGRTWAPAFDFTYMPRRP